MATSETPDTTQLLARVQQRDASAAEQLMERVYDEFRAMAAAYLSREPAGHTLQPTALVHEAFLKLVDQDRVDWKGRSHFMAIGAQAMRRILVDHARQKGRAKRGGGRQRISLDEHLTVWPYNEHDVLDVDDALEQLARLDPRQAKIVELRFFGGLTAAEVAEYLAVSKATVDREWRVARAWLRQQFSEDDAT